MTKYCYYLAAIGSPNFQRKLEILDNNLNNIYDQIRENYDIVINYYDDGDLQTYVNQEKFPFLNNIYIHKQHGILVQLWDTNPYHSLMNNYDYILFFLDDIKIVDMDLNKMIKIKNELKIQLMSPKVLGSTYLYLRHLSGDFIALTNRLEIYMLLLTYEDFNTYMSVNDVENANLWGVDLLTEHFGILTGIYYGCVVSHELPSLSNKQQALQQMNSYLAKHGFTSEKVFQQYPLDIK